jgi:hypothetical protein
VRESEFDNKFYKKIVKMLLRDEEIAKIKLKSTYEDDDWIIPAFILRAKEVSLPKVNGRAVMEREKDERELEFRGGGVGQTEDEIAGGRSRSTGESESDNGDTS